MIANDQFRARTAAGRAPRQRALEAEPRNPSTGALRVSNAYPVIPPAGRETGLRLVTPRWSGRTRLRDPYGREIRAAGTLAAWNRIRFSTKYHDPETGLVYYGYRFYSPRLGRWMRRDPLEECGAVLHRAGPGHGCNPYASESEDTANLLRFVGNSPENRIDSLGLACTTLFGWPAGFRRQICSPVGAPHPVWYMKGFDFQAGEGPASCVCQCEKALVQNQVCYYVRQWKLVVLCCEGCPPRCRTKTATTWKRSPEFEEPKILQVLDGRDMYAIGPTPEMCEIVCVFACGNLNFDEDYSPS